MGYTAKKNCFIWSNCFLFVLRSDSELCFLVYLYSFHLVTIFWFNWNMFIDIGKWIFWKNYTSGCSLVELVMGSFSGEYIVYFIEGNTCIYLVLLLYYLHKMVFLFFPSRLNIKIGGFKRVIPDLIISRFVKMFGRFIPLFAN